MSEALVSSLQVKVEYLGHIRHTLGSEREEEVEIEDDALVVDLLNLLSDRYGEPFKKTIYELVLKTFQELRVLLKQLN